MGHRKYPPEAIAACARAQRRHAKRDNHATEARGLQLVSEAVAGHGTLRLSKSAEGARADFTVYAVGAEDRAIGVQLKTTAQAKEIGKGQNDFARFAQTLGYDGLMLLLIAILPDGTRAWLMSGTVPRSENITISLHPTRKFYDWQQHEIVLSEFGDHLSRALHREGLDVKPATAHMMPDCYTRRVEYEAFLRLRDRLPLNFVEPAVEHRPYDYVVDGRKWQLKSASYIASCDYFQCPLTKHMGRVNGKPTKGQYARCDFQWLAALLPEGNEKLRAPFMFLIPMAVLVAKGLAGRGGNVKSSLKLYPHRAITENGADPVHWAQRWLVDLSSHSAAMADYQRVLQASH